MHKNSGVDTEDRKMIWFTIFIVAHSLKRCHFNKKKSGTNEEKK